MTERFFRFHEDTSLALTDQAWDHNGRLMLIEDYLPYDRLETPQAYAFRREGNSAAVEVFMPGVGILQRVRSRSNPNAAAVLNECWCCFQDVPLDNRMWAVEQIQNHLIEGLRQAHERNRNLEELLIAMARAQDTMDRRQIEILYRAPPFLGPTFDTLRNRPVERFDNVRFDNGRNENMLSRFQSIANSDLWEMARYTHAATGRSRETDVLDTAAVVSGETDAAAVGSRRNRETHAATTGSRRAQRMRSPVLDTDVLRDPEVLRDPGFLDSGRHLRIERETIGRRLE